MKEIIERSIPTLPKQSVTTKYFNKDNYFINDKNYFRNVYAYNILCIPNEKTFDFNPEKYDKVEDAYTSPYKLISEIT